MLSESDLRPYQADFVDFLVGGEATFGSVEMGLGKTISVLTAIKRIIVEDAKRGRKRRFVVFGPKRVAKNVWHKEVEKWAHTRDLKVAIAVGPVAKRAHAVTDPNADIVTINYENMKWFFEFFPRGTLPFYGVVLDEIDKMKDPDTARFEKARYRMYEFKWRVGMTGTPTPEHLLNLWGPFFLLTAGPVEPNWTRYPPIMRSAVGQNVTDFKRTYFTHDPYTKRYEARPGAVDKIAAMIAPITFQARAADHLQLPKVIVQDIEYELSPSAKKEYEQFEKDFIVRVDAGDLTAANEDENTEWLEFTDEIEIKAANAAVLKNKLRQLCSGFLYYPIPPTPAEIAKAIAAGRDPKMGRGTQWYHKEKTRAYDDLRSELLGAPHLAVYGYQAEVEECRFKHRLGSHLSDRDEDALLDRWDRGELSELAIHPASAGHGLNLQEGGARHIVFLTLPWSRGLYDQTIARLVRMGQKHETVIVHRFIARGTVEQDVVEALAGKAQVQEFVIDRIRARTAA